MCSIHQNEKLAFYLEVNASHAPFIVFINIALVNAFALIRSSLFIPASRRQYKPVPLILADTRNIENPIRAIVSVNVLNSHLIFILSRAFHHH